MTSIRLEVSPNRYVLLRQARHDGTGARLYRESLTGPRRSALAIVLIEGAVWKAGRTLVYPRKITQGH